MIIYFVIASVLLLIAFLCKYDKKIFAIMCMILTIIGYFRDINVGTDLSGSYLYNWNAINMDSESWGVYSEMEPGFMFIMAFFKTYITDDYRMWYGLMFLITMIGFSIMIKHYCINPILGLALFVLLFYYTSTFNAIRQMFALSLVAFPLKKTENNNKLQVTILFVLYIVTISFLFHRTLIVLLLPFFILKFRRINSFFLGKKIIIMLIISYFILISINSFRFLLPYFSASLSILGTRYVNYIDVYLSHENNVYSLYSAFLRTIVAIAIVYYYHKYNIKNINNYFYISLILGVIINNCLGGLSAVFLRVGENLLFFEIVLYANLLTKKYTILSCIILCYGTIIFVKAIIQNFSNVVPYSNYLF